MFMDGLVVVITPFILLYIKRSVDLLIEIAIGMNIIAMILMIAIRIPESLRFMISKG